MRGNIEFKELKEYFVTNEITNSYSVNSFKKFFFLIRKIILLRKCSYIIKI